MRVVLAFLLLAPLLAPRAGRAAELELGVTAQGAYDDNVFSLNENKQDDFLGIVGTNVALSEELGKFRFEAEYRPRFEMYEDNTSANGWDHTLLFDGQWEPTRTTVVQLRNRFDRLNSPLRFNAGVVDSGLGAPEFDIGQQTFTRNFAELEVIHDFGRTRQLDLYASYTWRKDDSEAISEGDRWAVSARGEFSWAATARTRLGLGFGYRRQTRDSSDVQQETSTDFYNFFGSASHSFSPSWIVSVAAGPTWSVTDPRSVNTTTQLYPLIGRRFVNAETCPRTDGVSVLAESCDAFGSPVLTDGQVAQFNSARVGLPVVGPDPERSDSTLTYFANASIRKRWERWTATASYRRTGSTAAQLGSSTVADTVTAELGWSPASRWQVKLSGSFTRQEQLNESVVGAVQVENVELEDLDGDGNDDEAAESRSFRTFDSEGRAQFDFYSAQLYTAYRVDRRATVFSRFSFFRQETDFGTVGSTGINRFRVVVGLTWTFEPFEF